MQIKFNILNIIKNIYNISLKIVGYKMNIKKIKNNKQKISIKMIIIQQDKIIKINKIIMYLYNIQFRAKILQIQRQIIQKIINFYNLEIQM